MRTNESLKKAAQRVAKQVAKQGVKHGGILAALLALACHDRGTPSPASTTASRCGQRTTIPPSSTSERDLASPSAARSEGQPETYQALMLMSVKPDARGCATDCTFEKAYDLASKQPIELEPSESYIRSACEQLAQREVHAPLDSTGAQAPRQNMPCLYSKERPTEALCTSR
ncbi:MAG: hypothetical protein U0165_14810 [Polyangiaceae bacterium]